MNRPQIKLLRENPASRRDSRNRAAFCSSLFSALLPGLVTCLLASAPVAAVEPTTPLDHLARQSWTMENGLPQNTVQSLVADKDGFLWIGTELGLVRYDGYGFLTLGAQTRPALTAADVRGIFQVAPGEFWLATPDGISRISGTNGWQQTQNFTAKDGAPEGLLKGVLTGIDGREWLWTEHAIVEFSAGHFVALPTPRSTIIRSLTRDSAGNLWTATNSGVFEWRANGSNSQWHPLTTGTCTAVSDSLATVVFDTLWVSCSDISGTSSGILRSFPHQSGASLKDFAPASVLPKGRVEFLLPLNLTTTAIASLNELSIIREGRLIGHFETGKELSGTRIQTLRLDRRGALWIGTNRGLARWADGRLDRFGSSEILSSASILAIDEDREGNLWVGTESSGISVLRDERFRALTTDDGLPSDATTAVVEDNSGALWVGTNGAGIAQLANGASHNWTTHNGLLSDVILSLAAAHDGTIWIGTPDGLNALKGNQLRAFTSTDGLPDDFVRSLLADADGSLWIGTRRGLAHWRDGKLLSTLTTADGLGSNLIGAMTRDRDGRLWIATLDGLSVLEGGHLHNYRTTDGLPANVITAIEARPDGRVLVGTAEHGWALWSNGHFLTAPYATKESIHAILTDHLGVTWFATANSIARCKIAPTATPLCDSWTEFTTADGMRSREMARNSHPSAMRGQDGRIWFATPKGLVELNPAHFHLNTLLPPVVIERMGVDDASDYNTNTNSKGELVVAAGHAHFEFEYAALSFTAPQKLRYRYKLEGFDKDWIDAGARRTAYYTNIPPGHYTFHVQAANNDGIWSEDGAELSFQLRPHFYQTWLFWLLIVVLLTALGIGAARLYERRKLAHANREFSAVLSERSRIAREIHDTLAQGYVGISVQLEVLSELVRLGKLDKATKQLGALKEIVRDGLTDARQSIWALRSPDAAERTLPVELQRLVEAASTKKLNAHLRIHGAYRPIDAHIEQELLRIAQEAIQNTRKHAEATRLEVELNYFVGSAKLPGDQTPGLAMEIRDDGRGMDLPAGSTPQSPVGHYGFTGIAERSAAIGAVLNVQSAPGRGTTVRVELNQALKQALKHSTQKLDTGESQ